MCLALSNAIKKSDLPLIQSLLKGDDGFLNYLATVNMWDEKLCPHWRHNFAPLHMAAMIGNPVVLKMLLENCKMKPNSRQNSHGGINSRTPLHMAILTNNVTTVKYLLSFGANALEGGRSCGKEFKNALEFIECSNITTGHDFREMTNLFAGKSQK